MLSTQNNARFYLRGVFKYTLKFQGMPCVDFVGGLSESRRIIYKNKITPKVNVGILKCEF